MKFYISIHDVKPDNINKVTEIIDLLLNQYKIAKICLLVIPGLKWEKKHINRLLNWQIRGIEIAAHGWTHKANDKRTLFHKLHSLFISKNCAEHLSKNTTNICKIMEKSFNWFIDNGFKKPTLYVPPGWAIGNIDKNDLSRLQFTHIECTTGFVYKKKYKFIPLIGFEESNYIKGIIRRFCNYLNFILGQFIGYIRIAIHPNDFELFLKDDIYNYLSKSNETVLLNEIK